MRAEKSIANWGNYPVTSSQEYSFSGGKDLDNLLKDKSGYIARGNGRCYGDASLSDTVVSTLKHSSFLFFDEKTGILECESGITFERILEVIIPKGWFLPVTPGTKYITLGGAVASDVHGKNHHKEGSFSNHIIDMKVLAGDGVVYTCNRQINNDLFEATCGGMGLTGVILSVRFQLKPIETAFIRKVTKRASNLDQIFDLFEEYSDYTYTMSWIDCYQSGKKLGRSVMFAGEHALRSELSAKQQKSPFSIGNKKKIKIPFYFPANLMNNLTIRSFNFLYYRVNRSNDGEISDYDSFFYPLDSLLEWNKMYGKPGFLQYQFVLPMESSKEGLIKILSKINDANMGSFLAVLKLFGEQEDLISFPMKGYTLALDFPIKKRLFPFLEELDRIVIDYGGRLYLSKDARMTKDTFWDTYPKSRDFLTIVERYNPGKISSVQSQRLSITP